MPDGTKYFMVMAQNVYMASLAFLVPLPRVKMQYKKSRPNLQILDTLFALYPNAKCKCWDLGFWFCANPASSKVFYFKSRYNGIDYVWREVKVKPMLMELYLESKHKRHYFLVLTVSIDKVFGNKNLYSSHDFCTEFDIVNLKKAFFEHGQLGLFENRGGNGLSFHIWLQEILYELYGKNCQYAKLSYSIIDISTQVLNITAINNTIMTVNQNFTSMYYQGGAYGEIEDFLTQNITLLQSNGLTTVSAVPEKNFVYGLLYANDNFMMAHKDTADKTINSCYSNNKVEKYWADDECIVHVKIRSPFHNSMIQNNQQLTGDLKKELPTLLDMGMLIHLKRSMQQLLSKQKDLSPQKIEDECGKLSKLFYDKLFNQTEMDKRMDYFIRNFHLREMLDEVRHIVASTGNSKKLFSMKIINFWTLLIALLTLAATIIGIIVSH